MMPYRSSFDFQVPQSDATTMRTYGPPAAWPANRQATFYPTMTYPRVPDEDAPDPRGAVRVIMPRGQQPPLHALGLWRNPKLFASPPKPVPQTHYIYDYKGRLVPVQPTDLDLTTRRWSFVDPADGPPGRALGAVDSRGRRFGFGGLGADADTDAKGNPRSLIGRWFYKGTDAFFDKDTSSSASRLVALLVFGLVTLSAVKAAPKIFGSI